VRANPRYRCSLVYRSGVVGGQRAFFRALRVGPRLASLVGSVVVDVEEVPLKRDEQREGRGVEAAEQDVEEEEGEEVGEGGELREGGGGGAPPPPPPGGPPPPPPADDDDDSFEHVGVCRRMTLAQLYTMLRPSLHQIAVEQIHAAFTAAAGDGAPRSPPTSPPGLIDDDDGLCSICMDSALQVVTRCTHAFCEECYLRWLALSRECPLCRERLGLELTGTNDGSYALVSWGDHVSNIAAAANTTTTTTTSGGSGDDGGSGGGGGEQTAASGASGAAASGAAEGRVEDVAVRDGEGEGHAQQGQRVDAEWLRGRLRSLPAVAEPGRRAHEQWLLRRMREREQEQAARAAATAGAGAGRDESK
jgi:hypothetical protein